MINVFQPTVGQEELDAVRRVFESGWLGRGELTRRFEEAFANYIGVEENHIVNTTCATEGLFQVIRLLDVRHVVLPTISFIGAGNAAIEAGCYITLCDVDPRTLNPRPADIERALRDLHGPAAIILLHYGGIPCDMDGLIEIKMHRPQTYFVEDCGGGAFASVFNGQMCGTYGRFGVWSFDAMKTLTTGDGGMVYCQREEDAALLRRRLYMDMDSESGYSSGNTCWWEFHSGGHGRRAVLNDIAASIGLEQLKKLPAFLARRLTIWDRYNDHLHNQDWLTLPPPIPDGIESSYAFYWIQTDRRDELAQHLRKQGIYTTFRYYPLHRAYGLLADLPGADWAADHTLLLPLHTGLSDGDVDTICDAVRDFERVRA